MVPGVPRLVTVLMYLLGGKQVFIVPTVQGFDMVIGQESTRWLSIKRQPQIPVGLTDISKKADILSPYISLQGWGTNKLKNRFFRERNQLCPFQSTEVYIPRQVNLSQTAGPENTSLKLCPSEGD